MQHPAVPPSWPRCVWGLCELGVMLTSLVPPKSSRQFLAHVNAFTTKSSKVNILSDTCRCELNSVLLNTLGFHFDLSQPFISGDSDGNNIPEGDQRATEIERIAGRQTNPKTMGTRRLSRAKTRSQSLFVTTNTNVVIGVSVERTTTDCPGPTEPSWTVHAPNPRRARAFTIDFLPSNHPGPNLVGRAKEFAQRIRRKKEN